MKIQTVSRTGVTTEETIVGGYFKDETLHLLTVTEGDEGLAGVQDVYRITDGIAYWGGGLRALAQERFDAAQEGDIFRYNNKPLRRATQEELARVDGQTFEWRLDLQ